MLILSAAKVAWTVNIVTYRLINELHGLIVFQHLWTDGKSYSHMVIISTALKVY